MPVTPDATDIENCNKATDESNNDHDIERASSKVRSVHSKGYTIVVTIVIVVVIAICACGVAYVAKKLCGTTIEPGQPVTVTINKGS